MRRDRPTAVLVMAILNFVFGGLGLTCLLCAAAGFGMIAAMGQNQPPPQPGQPDLGEMIRGIKAIPGFVPYMIVSTALGTIANIVLIVAGFGLLKMRPWARWVCVGYAIYTIIATMIGLGYTISVVNPAMEEVMRKQAAVAGAGAGGPGGMQNTISSIAGSLIGLAYSIALLVVLFLPQVRLAFAGKWRRPDPEEEEYRDDTLAEDEPRRPRRDDHGIRPGEDYE